MLFCQYYKKLVLLLEFLEYLDLGRIVTFITFNFPYNNKMYFSIY